MNMPRPSYFWLYGLAAVFIIGWAVMGGGNDAPQPSDWTSVERMVEQGEVERIQVVNRDQAQVFLREEAIGKYRNDAENRQYARIPESGAQLLSPSGPSIRSART